MTSPAARYEQAAAKLKKTGQAHVLRYWDELSDAQRAALLDQVESVDWEACAALVEPYVRNRPHVKVPDDIRPVPVLPAQPAEADRAEYERARALGVAALRGGKVAAFTVAGGQGTRLGFDGPKGAFRISPIRNAPLFQLFAEQILGTQRRYGHALDWYIMTSPGNHAATQSFFRENNYFGLDADRVIFFMQGQMPAFLPDGRAAMAGPGELALSPDGHGGSLRALERNGCLARMRQAGVEYISYFQVDNPLVHACDPLFIGLHIARQSEMSSKAVTKASDREKVGNFCLADGVLQVIEYSDLPDELADAKNPDGSRRFDAGSIAIHVLNREFVERLTGPGSKLTLPWHRADKAVAVMDDARNVSKPTSPNVVKLEMFVFDAIPLARNPLVLYTERAEEFSPVKNATGSDSPETTRRDLVRRAARWLEGAGVEVPRVNGEPSQLIEIDARFAVDAEELAGRVIGRSFDWSKPVLVAE
jgi:UDP-N-acetylglucosamine/UDP-N-acetylgalactosamine diphosphorylase